MLPLWRLLESLESQRKPSLKVIVSSLFLAQWPNVLIIYLHHRRRLSKDQEINDGLDIIVHKMLRIWGRHSGRRSARSVSNVSWWIHIQHGEERKQRISPVTDSPSSNCNEETISSTLLLYWIALFITLVSKSSGLHSLMCVQRLQYIKVN